MDCQDAYVIVILNWYNLKYKVPANKNLRYFRLFFFEKLDCILFIFTPEFFFFTMSHQLSEENDVESDEEEEFEPDEKFKKQEELNKNKFEEEGIQ